MVQEEDDEVVIQAGCSVSRLQPEPSEASGSSAVGGESCRFSEDRPEGDFADAGKKHPSRGPKRGKNADRMVTTEEDLKEEVPFSGMRRVILVLAVVAIAAMAVYCRFGS